MPGHTILILPDRPTWAYRQFCRLFILSRFRFHSRSLKIFSLFLAQIFCSLIFTGFASAQSLCLKANSGLNLMNRLSSSGRIKKFRFQPGLLTLTLLIPHLAAAQTQPVTVSVAADADGADLPPCFLGLSYVMSMLLPKDGQYYFDPKDQALVNTFHTLGIKSLRVGANAVDDPRIPIPQEKDIDELFDFARAAGVKVIYS